MSLRRPPGTEIIGRLGMMISPTAIAMLSLLENFTDKQYFQVWAIFSTNIFFGYYSWLGRRMSLLTQCVVASLL